MRHDLPERRRSAAGQKIIADEGFSKFSTRKVAKEIGYTVGTLYTIFESHDDLILHINAAMLERMHDFIIQRINKKHRGAEAIKELEELYIKCAENNYNLWSALFEFNLPQNTSVPDWYAEKNEALFGVVEHPLKNLNNAHRHAKTLWASLHGVCHLGLTSKLDALSAYFSEVAVNVPKVTKSCSRLKAHSILICMAKSNM